MCNLGSLKFSGVYVVISAGEGVIIRHAASLQSCAGKVPTEAQPHREAQ